MAEQDITREIAALHLRLDALRVEQQRFLHIEAGYGSMNPTVPDAYEAVYAGLDERQDDRLECAEGVGLTQLHAQMNAMQAAREQEQQRGHEQGLGF